MSLFRENRRRFIASFASLSPCVVVPAAPRGESPAPRVLGFDHFDAGERLRAEYYSGGRCLPDALDLMHVDTGRVRAW